MSFISQLLITFIIFGLVATISIAIVIAFLGKKQKDTNAAEHARNHSSLF